MDSSASSGTKYLNQPWTCSLISPNFQLLVHLWEEEVSQTSGPNASLWWRQEQPVLLSAAAGTDLWLQSHLTYQAPPALGNSPEHSTSNNPGMSSFKQWPLSKTVTFLPQETFPHALPTAHLNWNGFGKAVIFKNSKVSERSREETPTIRGKITATKDVDHERRTTCQRRPRTDTSHAQAALAPHITLPPAPPSELDLHSQWSVT